MAECGQGEGGVAVSAPIILGLDLSLRGLGMVAVPAFWRGDWARIARRTVGHPLPKDATEADRIGRLVRLSGEVVAFGRAQGCTHAVVEQYAFTSRNAHSHALGELGGAVKVAIVAKMPVETVPPASARKLLLGKLPRRDVKAAVRAHLTAIGMPASWTDDEADAWVAANWVLAGIGGFAFAEVA